ncbi:MAG: vWA domain-containing protein [Planctomycetaceae bacterium]
MDPTWTDPDQHAAAAADSAGGHADQGDPDPTEWDDSPRDVSACRDPLPGDQSLDPQGASGPSAAWEEDAQDEDAAYEQAADDDDDADGDASEMSAAGFADGAHELVAGSQGEDAAAAVVLLELDATDTDGPLVARRGSLSGTLLSIVLHVWLILTLAGIAVVDDASVDVPPLISRVENVEPEPEPEPEDVVEYELVNPDDRELEVRKVVNAASMGLVKNRKPKLEIAPRPLSELELAESRKPMYDIPEGMEVNQELVVKGSTGLAIMELESALDRVTWEIAVNLQERKVLVVWLLDASASLEKQREVIGKRFQRIYGELDALEDIGQVPRLKKPLLTGVVSYGLQTRFLTREPTDNFEKIQEALAQVEPDESGVENVFTAITRVIRLWGKYRALNGRRIMLIAVTDESGDDFAMHETAIANCRRYGAKAYVIGPAAAFGRRKGFVPYVAPENGQTYRLPVDLGPDTAMYENVLLPFWFDGPQYSYLSAGYGPYGLARLVKETGGVYFTTNTITMSGLSTVGDFDPELMKPVEPDYRFGTRDEYTADLVRHPLRAAVVRAAQLSREHEPEGTPTLRMRVTAGNFRTQASNAQRTVARSQLMLDSILVAYPPGIEKRYERESSLRWRMAFALSYGRLLAQKVRCLEYNYALAELKGSRSEQDISTRSNEWIFRPAAELNYAANARQMAQLAQDLLQQVLQQAPGTPFATLARRELKDGMGIRVVERFIPPPPPRPVQRPAANANAKKRVRLAADPKKKVRPRPVAPAPRPIPPRLPRL